MPKRHAAEIVDWLHVNVSANRTPAVPRNEWTTDSEMNPYHLSAAAMRAEWVAQDGSWSVTQWGNRSHVQVQCRDPEIETWIAMRWS